MAEEINCHGATKSVMFHCGVVEGFYGKPWTTEQRSHLFRQLKKLGMNTYLYAPKDDLKHRAEWRIRYTCEEAELLRSLICAAAENKIRFIYALSPGIDIIYSNPKEIQTIQTKLLQVRALGCDAFALLFDDIEISMNDEDRRAFSSFAAAQASVSNKIYESLKCELFCFCPTEYCESRAIPSLEQSEYLNTIGANLHPEIHILWTGPRVVSRLLTVEHADRVARVIRRPPLIWDNLHANDYDPKRIFLGPLNGRLLELKDHISGLLLNPNSKYEANFIPLHTLADWHNPSRPKISTCGEKATRPGTDPEKYRYDPEAALKEAMDDWLHHFHHGPGPAIPPSGQTDAQTVEPVMISSSALKISDGPTSEVHRTVSMSAPVYTSPPMMLETTTSTSPQTLLVPLERLEPWRDGGKPLSEVVLGIPEPPEVIISAAVNSLTNDYSEPMDTSTHTQKDEDKDENQSSHAELTSSDTDMDEDLRVDKIDADKIHLLADIFYLPFEHGDRGLQLLEDFEWLHHNADSLNSQEGDRKREWHERSVRFKASVEKLTSLYKLVIESPNKSLVQEIFPYIWEAHGLLSVVASIIDWMGAGNLLYQPNEGCAHWWNSDEDRNIEPWAIGGGLLMDMQKLIANTSQMIDVFAVKFSIPLSLTCYSIRFTDGDDLNKSTIYEFAIPSEKQAIESIVGGNGEDLFFDRTISHFLKYGAPAHHHFVAEEQSPLQGPITSSRHCFSLVVGIFDVRSVLESYRKEFVPAYKSKYTQRISNDSSASEAEKSRRIQAMNSDIGSFPLNQILPEQLYSAYPSMVEFRWRHYTTEAVWGKYAQISDLRRTPRIQVSVRRLFHSVSATLSMNGK